MNKITLLHLPTGVSWSSKQVSEVTKIDFPRMTPYQQLSVTLLASGFDFVRDLYYSGFHDKYSNPGSRYTWIECLCKNHIDEFEITYD